MRVKQLIGGLAAIATLGACAGGESTAADGGRRAALVATIDSIVQEPIDAGYLAGASIAVVRGRDTIVAKGYGRANIELDVPTPPRAIYEMGSITKQFTGAAMMQLVEQGKIRLDDDLATHMPTFKTGGRKITVRRLLDHTSGIKGYTEIPEFDRLSPLVLPRDTLLQIVASKPFDFEPGEEQIYNNSAFFLAGLIIEKVSGMPYEKYVEENLFKKAGMKEAHYCSEKAVKKGKTTGYDADSSGPVQKGFLSHQWPFAAGSLCTSALDLVAWNEALHRDGKIMNADSYKAFITPEQLNDGYTIGYANGLVVTPRIGRRALHHGGGINGWVSENIYFPEESLSVVVLFNTAGRADASGTAEAIAVAVLGKAPDVSKPVEGDVARFAGTYAGRGRGRATELKVVTDSGALSVDFRGEKRKLIYVGDNTFVAANTKFIFGGGPGSAATLRVDASAGNNMLHRQ